MKLWAMRYGDEPVNGRLFLLRFIRKIHVIIISVIAGALLVCACHVAYRALTPVYYMTECDIHLDYIPEADANLMIFYNEYAWEQMSQDSAFIEAIVSADPGLDFDTVKESFSATLKSDMKILTFQVKNTDPDLALRIADASLKGGISFVESLPEVTGSEVIGMPYYPERITFDTRSIKALVLGAVLGLIASSFCISYMILSDDRIILPETIEKRYHTPYAGTLDSECLKDSLSDLAGDDGFVIASTLPSDKESEVIKKLKSLGVPVSDKPLNLIDDESKELHNAVKDTMIPVVYVFSSLLDIKADQRGLSLLSRFDREPICAILTDQDDLLIKAYYLGKRSGYTKDGKKDNRTKK